MSSVSRQSSRWPKEYCHQEHNHLSKAGTPSPSTGNESDDALNKMLAKLAHLDLTQHVHRDGAVMKAHGGYCDVFMGSVSIPYAESRLGDCASVKKDSARTKVAIKRLRVHMQSDRDFAKLLAKELNVWSKLDHANILPLVGYVLEGDYPSVISEWIENGTVGRYLRENPETDPVPLIIGIADGMEYLHRQNIVHSDIKADNVLVSSSGEPLICDFGISRMLASSLSIDGTSTGGLKGSIRWMAFELLDITGDAHHTKETDVWAFGMTVYEILTKEIPYARLKHDVLVMFAILQGELPSSPSHFNEWSPPLQFIWRICEECWISPPEYRIAMESVVNSLYAATTIIASPDPLQLPRECSPSLTSMMYSSVPPLTPDSSTSSSEGLCSGRVSQSSFSHDLRYSCPSTPLFPIEEDPEQNYLEKKSMRSPGLHPYELSGSRPGTSQDQHAGIISLSKISPPRFDDGPEIDKLLLRDSPSLVDFELRSPVTSIRKLVFGRHWTHLNYHDLSRAASDPPCDSMQLTTTAFSDWIIDVQCVPSGGRSFVTVKDVLVSVHRLFRLASSQERDAESDVLMETAISVLDLEQYRFGGLYPEHGGRNARLWEVHMTHAMSSGVSPLSSSHLF